MTTSQPIKVMLVDDHTMVRRGLVTFLKVLTTWNWWAKRAMAKLLSNCVPASCQM